jgi:CBS-domain-containing membrane protein
MREMGTKTWPVTEGRRLVGTVAGKHPDLDITSHGHDPKSWSVSEIMNRETVFCYEDEDCASAWRLMEEHDLSYIPVVDREMQLVGIFDREEIAKKATSSKAARSTGFSRNEPK